MKKILLLEDNSFDIALVSREIKNRWPAVELTTVSRVAEAKKLITLDSNFDIAIFDIKLPDGNGLELLTELRLNSCQLPIIIYTSVGSEDIAVTALKAGANDYIPKKPGFHQLIPDQLLCVLEESIGKSKQLNILYVEHHKADIELTAHYFKKHAPQLHISTVSNGELALKELPLNKGIASKYDVLMLDYRLPGSNALDIVKIIRQERKLFIPIIIITGQGDENTAVEALKIGADDYVVKHENYLLRLPSVITSAYRRRELERHQNALRSSETKYRILADYAADWEYWVNPQKEYLYNSPVCEDTTGYTHDDFLKNKNLLQEITLPEYKNVIDNHFSHQQIRMHEPIEFKIKAKDGTEKWISHFCRPVYDEDNNYLGQRGTNRDITLEKQHLDAILKFNLAIKNATDVVFITDKEGIITFINPQFTRLYGYTIDEIVGKQTPRILKSGVQSDDDYVKFWDSITHKKSVNKFEFINKAKNGNLVIVEASASPIINDQDQIIGFMGIQRDIEDRKRAETIQNIILNISNASQTDLELEEFLKLVQLELGRLVDTSNFFVALYDEKQDTIHLPYYYDEKDDIVDFPAGRTLTGYLIKNGQSLLLNKTEIQELSNEKVLEVVGENPEIWLGVPLIIKEKITGAFVLQSYSNANAYTDKDKDILEIIGNQISISIERIRYEDELKKALEIVEKSEQSLNNAQVMANMGSWRQDLITYKGIWSKNCYVLFGYKPFEFEPTFEHFKNRVHPDDVHIIDKVIEECSKTNSEVKSEFRFLMPDNTVKWLYTSVIPLFEEGKLIALTGTNIDITEHKLAEVELKKALEKAKESDRLKSAFLANMSHEIRTPMSGILGFSDLLKKSDLSTERQQKYIEIIEKSGQRMLTTINDIMDISKIEAGLMTTTISELNIKERAEEIYNFFKLEAGKKGLELSLKNELKSTDEIMTSDNHKIYSVLTNLVKNAIKFTNIGEIEMGLKKTDNMLELYVKDTGIGIPLDRQPHIFDRFVQADIEDKLAHQGSGLGLAITKSYVEMLGGKIWVTSVEGNGSQFNVVIPYHTNNLSLIVNELTIRRLVK